MKIAYIAAPYRAGIGRTVLENVRIAEKAAIKYWKRGYAVICPHLNSAFMDGIMPDETFLIADLEFVRVCDVFILIGDWRNSTGAMNEYAIAATLKKQIIFDEDERESA